MKKLFLSLAMVVALLFAVNGESKAQTALYVQGGYSWLEGVISGGGQIGHLGVMAGWFPAKMPLSGEQVSGVCWDITYYDGLYYQSGYYASIGMNSAGYRYEDSRGYNSVVPMWIAMLGYKYGSDNLYTKVGLGYGWCDQGSAFTYEITLGLALGN